MNLDNSLQGIKVLIKKEKIVLCGKGGSPDVGVEKYFQDMNIKIVEYIG